MRASLTITQANTTLALSPVPPDSDTRAPLFRRWQTCGSPSFETAGHRADVFVAHFLQTLSGERGTAPSAARTNDPGREGEDFFFDIELDGTATHVDGVRNMFLVPFVFLTNIDDHRFAALYFLG